MPPKTRREVIALVQRIVESKGIVTEVTTGWWESFCSRNPNLTLRIPAPLSQARSKATDPEVVSLYFNMLEQTMSEYCLFDCPAQIFNMDETGMPLSPPQVKSVCMLGEKNPIAPASGDKTQITVVACVNATGNCMPPMVILDRKKLPLYFTVADVPGTVYGLSPRGWIDQELFSSWFSNHFLRYAPSVRPLLLLMDGHSSHYCPDAIRLAAKEDVLLFTLPPNSTHLLQPLDRGMFSPLKTFWKEECHNYMTRHPGKVVNRFSNPF